MTSRQQEKDRRRQERIAREQDAMDDKMDAEASIQAAFWRARALELGADATEYENSREDFGDIKPLNDTVAAILVFFRHDHLPPHLQEISEPFAILASQFVDSLDGPELTAGLRKLLEAKDCMVRARTLLK